MRSLSAFEHMKGLESYFLNNPGGMIHKWMHYFEIYERHLACFRGAEVNLVEIDVYQSGSLQMRKRYFGERATIWGVDINPLCRQFEEDRVPIFIGDQADRRGHQPLTTYSSDNSCRHGGASPSGTSAFQNTA